MKKLILIDLFFFNIILKFWPSTKTTLLIQKKFTTGKFLDLS